MSITEELREWKGSGSGSTKPRLRAVGISCAGNATASTAIVGTNFADSGGRSVCVVRLRAKATEFSLVLPVQIEYYNGRKQIDPKNPRHWVCLPSTTDNLLTDSRFYFVLIHKFTVFSVVTMVWI
jgi:hypothetical protein